MHTLGGTYCRKKKFDIMKLFRGTVSSVGIVISAFADKELSVGIKKVK